MFSRRPGSLPGKDQENPDVGKPIPFNVAEED